jgi:transposase InsO family protein
MDERQRFVREYHRQAVSFSELCRQFTVSRKTGYKWVDRSEEEGKEGLLDRSRAPLEHPNATAEDLEEVIVELRMKNPTWGPRKIRAWLVAHIPERAWPATSTIGEIIKRRGLVMPKSKRRRSPPFSQPFAHADQPNAVWCADFKGWFRTGDGTRCDPLTVTDAFSRYLLCARAVDRPDAKHVKPAFERTFREFGLPLAIRTDNGPPFATTAVAGLSQLAVWFVRLGIRQERITPGKPQQNGRHERMHRTMKAETARPPHANVVKQQRAFDRFQTIYNQERPHEALEMQPPATLYVPSCRLFPNKLPELVYPVNYDLRHVRPNGEIKLAGTTFFVSEALVGEVVGLQRLDERYWQMHFGPVPLGCVDAKLRQWTTRAQLVAEGLLPMSPV